MSRVAVEGWNHVPVGEQNFASRVKWLKTKLELGSLHLGLSFPFTGIQLTQLPNFECIQLSLENYLQKVKPIALSKERRQNPHAETTAQEKHQLRGLNGSMDWPVTQLMLYVEGLNPAPHIHEQMTTSNYGYDIAYNFTHNNIMLEPNAVNNMNTVAHMDVHNTQY